MRLQLPLTLVLLAFSAGCDFPIDIVRIAPEQFSNAQADAAISAANDIILEKTDSADVNCGATMARAGGVSVFNQPSGGDLHNVDTNQEMATLLGLNGYTKIVDQIDACGSVMDPAITGCATAFRMVIEDLIDNPTSDGFSFAAVTWAHEFAHTRGLAGHRPNSSSRLNIMHGMPLTNAYRLSASECEQMIAGPQINVPPQVAVAPEVDLDPELPLEEFVSMRYIDAVPYEQARSYGATVVPQLIAWLQDPGRRDQWNMITLVLGAVGGDEAALALMEFIERDRGLRVPRSELTAVSGALRSLGLVVARTGSSRALDYLWATSEPESWRQRPRMRWTSAYLRTLEDRNWSLARYAIMGLGLSGNAEARRMLEVRWKDTKLRMSSKADDRNQSMLEMIEMSMQHNENIRRDGLVEYYRFE